MIDEQSASARQVHVERGMFHESVQAFSSLLSAPKIVHTLSENPASSPVTSELDPM